MTVSITVERYWAVCRPTVCRHVFSNVDTVQKTFYPDITTITTCRRAIITNHVNYKNRNLKEYRNAGLVQNKNTRVAKYLIPVIIGSVLLNIPKFLETSVAYDEETGEVFI